MALWISNDLRSASCLKQDVEPQPDIKLTGTGSIHQKKSKVSKCCLCNKAMCPGKIVIEERPTAEDGSMQEWVYCTACWVELRRLREAPVNQQRLVDYLCSSVELDG